MRIVMAVLFLVFLPTGALAQFREAFPRILERCERVYADTRKSLERVSAAVAEDPFESAVESLLLAHKEERAVDVRRILRRVKEMNQDNQRKKSVLRDCAFDFHMYSLNVQQREDLIGAYDVAESLRLRAQNFQALSQVVIELSKDGIKVIEELDKLYTKK